MYKIKASIIMTVMMTYKMICTPVSAEIFSIYGRLVPSACMLETLPIVQLGNNISSAQLSMSDISQAQSSPVNFTVVLSHCPAITTKVTATITGTTDSADRTLFAITKGTGMADGIGILITDRDHGNVVLSDQGTSTVSISEAVPSNRTATFNWQASVKRSSFPVIAGKIQSSVMVNISYP
ncbi:TPA: type 1 fimbrial protein [Klebsiella variicola]|nr:type 1 fimbrial protein [Klebsiella variicola]